jgi:D-sedoheptulose 7-phosphate isomerase
VQVVARSVIARALEDHVAEVRSVLGEIPIASVELVVGAILRAHEGGHQIYIVGNGGSASTATHFACDLSKATIVDGQRLRATSLTDNVALLTAWANDTAFEHVFSEQLASLLRPGDVLIAISASGNSPNIVNAVRTARDKRAATVGLVGFDGGAVAGMVDVLVHVPSRSYGVVEDCHLVLEHAITASTRSALLA